MKNFNMDPAKKLSGEIAMPGDKSISHRAIILGSIAEGETRANGVLDCDDCNYTIRAFRDTGIAIIKEGDLLIIEGKGLRGLVKPETAINAGNSGTTMRLISGIIAGQNFEATIKGDGSLSKRPMERIAEPLSRMGATITASKGGYPPLRIKGGKLKAIDYKMPVASAQVKSAILLAGLYAEGITKIKEPHQSRDHTERMMRYFGADINIEGLSVSVKGPSRLEGRRLEIPGDISSASFFMVGAILLSGSAIKIIKAGINPTRAGILKVLGRMGADIKVINKNDSFEPYADIEISSGRTKGIVIEESLIPAVIDELPIIFVLASLSEGKTVIKGVSELKVKETNRINSMKHNLKNMGAKISVDKDDIIIEGVRQLKGARLKSFGDHRTCMAASIASLAAKGPSVIDDTECITKSFPEFFKILDKVKRC